MTIKDLAESIGIPQSKIKKLALELLGCIPAELTGEDESKIRAAIATTTQALAAASEDSLVVKDKEVRLTEQQETVKEILGQSLIKQLVHTYLFSLKQELDKQKFDADTLIFQSEQAFYSHLVQHQQTAQNESLDRVRRNANYYNLEGVKALSVAGGNDELLEQIAELMAVFAEDS